MASARRDLYCRSRRRIVIVLSAFMILGLVLSMERVVIDIFGQMWGTLVLNSISFVFCVAGLLGICAKDSLVIFLYSMWSFFSLGLNLVVVLIYNDVGLLRQKEHYLGLVIGNENFWRSHGLGCGNAINNNGSGGSGSDVGGDINITYAEEGSGSGLSLGGSGYELLEVGDGAELLDSCTVPYALIETIHATIYMLIALVSFILCWLLLCCHRKGARGGDYDDEEEEFSYVSVAQRYDYPQANRTQRHSFLNYW